ncbi:glycerol-3-phosphate dehydrogenase/oxidase [Dietzia sp. 179-F 9C3 NHS]|uniref:glycerol-3-phosphate dehydrogenase/oxidase n=1 Tax=Dietzia sp. 179-F 9C3 NHS TaxID=3374295 RepID=UPI0038798E3E
MTPPVSPPDATALSAARRARDLTVLRERRDPVDLVVIGGGITGVGIALDAASRGLETVLLEAHDLAWGTSRWSSKLAHGGLRYLASGDVGIARRSAVERGILLSRTAPHLTRPLAQVVPVYRGTRPAHAVLPGLGFLAGTVLTRLARTRRRLLPGARIVGPARVADLVPGVRREGLLFGHVNWDCQLVDDARLVVAVARTAAREGATILTRTRAVAASGTEVTVRDELAGAEFALPARAVVNATGVWADELAPGLRLRPSRGTHLVVRAEALGHPTGALTVAVPGSTNRFCFCLPAENGRVFVGLTDVDAPGPVPDVPTPDDDEVDFLLDVVGRALARPLTRDDVIGTFAGLRPLVEAGASVSAADTETADLSREHAILTAANGLVTVTGGKLTEYRLMTEQVVDLVVGRLAGRAARPCRTADLPLVGAGRDGTPAPSGGEPLPAPLVARFGAEAPAVVAASLLDRPLDPVAQGLDVTRAEFSWAVTHEGALDAGDVLDRRSRIGLVATDRSAAEPAAREALRAAAGR